MNPGSSAPLGSQLRRWWDSLNDDDKQAALDTFGELAGGTVGALSGSGVASIPAAGAGAVVGKGAARGVGRAIGLKPTPQSSGEVTKDIASTFATNAAGEGIGRAIQPAYRGVKSLAKRAAQIAVRPNQQTISRAAAAGVELTPGMVSDRPLVHFVESALEKTPGGTNTIRGKTVEAVGQWEDSARQIPQQFHPNPVSDVEAGEAAQSQLGSNRSAASQHYKKQYTTRVDPLAADAPIDFTIARDTARQFLEEFPQGMEAFFPQSQFKKLQQIAGMMDGQLVKPRAVTQPSTANRFQRVEEPGVGRASFDKPHGVYTTPATAKSPHSDLGGETSYWTRNADANILSIKEDPGVNIAMRGGTNVAGAGVWAARELLGPAEFERLRGLPHQDLVRTATEMFPTVQWDRYHDAQEVMEGIGGMVAKGKGYDGIHLSADEPQWDEFVGLTPKSMSPDHASTPSALIDTGYPAMTFAEAQKLRTALLEAERAMKHGDAAIKRQGIPALRDAIDKSIDDSLGNSMNPNHQRALQEWRSINSDYRNTAGELYPHGKNGNPTSGTIERAPRPETLPSNIERSPTAIQETKTAVGAPKFGAPDEQVIPKFQRNRADSLLDDSRTQNRFVGDQRFINPRRLEKTLDNNSDAAQALFGQGPYQSLRESVDLGKAITRPSQFTNTSETARFSDLMRYGGAVGGAVTGAVTGEDGAMDRAGRAVAGAAIGGYVLPKLAAKAWTSGTVRRALTTPPPSLTSPMGSPLLGAAGRSIMSMGKMPDSKGSSDLPADFLADSPAGDLPADFIDQDATARLKRAPPALSAPR